ncbi:MAG TPA: hypothetical protein V6D35_20960 [Candidatus Sericytochromatia bacterium]
MISPYWARVGNPAQIYQVWLLLLRSHPLKLKFANVQSSLYLMLNCSYLSAIAVPIA